MPHIAYIYTYGEYLEVLESRLRHYHSEYEKLEKKASEEGNGFANNHITPMLQAHERWFDYSKKYTDFKNFIESNNISPDSKMPPGIEIK